MSSVGSRLLEGPGSNLEGDGHMNALIAATLCSIVLGGLPVAAAAYVRVRRTDEAHRRRHW